MTITALYRQETGDTTSDPRTVAAAARRLTPSQRQALELRAADKTVREIGAALGISHGAAAGRVDRALHAMRKRIMRLPRYEQPRRRAG